MVSQIPFVLNITGLSEGLFSPAWLCLFRVCTAPCWVSLMLDLWTRWGCLRWAHNISEGATPQSSWAYKFSIKKELRLFETCQHIKEVGDRSTLGSQLCSAEVVSALPPFPLWWAPSPDAMKETAGRWLPLCHLKVRSSYLKTTAAPTLIWTLTWKSSCLAARAVASAPPP